MTPQGRAPYLNWRIRSHADVWRDLVRKVTPRRPLVIAVDGISGSGKTTLAAALADLHQRCAVVHTDDIAWHQSFFDWADLLIEHVLEPLRLDGAPITYTPQAWTQRNRPGAIVIDARTSVVLIEGVGAARRELRPWLDAVIWVDTQPDVGLARVAARGVDTPQFIDEWTREERAFLADHKPWEIADVLVSGYVREDLVQSGRVLAARGSGLGEKPSSMAAAIEVPLVDPDRPDSNDIDSVRLGRFGESVNL